jgi:hypothetical protein
VTLKLFLSQVVSSIWAIFDGAAYFIRGAEKKDLSNAIHKLKDVVLDEPISRALAGHASIIWTFAKPSVRPLVSKSSSLNRKYFQSYLVNSFKDEYPYCIACSSAPTTASPAGPILIVAKARLSRDPGATVAEDCDPVT